MSWFRIINPDSLIGELSSTLQPAGHLLVGSWRSETGSATHFYQDGTGKNEDADGEHEFAWETISIKEAVERGSDVREYF